MTGVCVYKISIEYHKKFLYLWESDDLKDYFIVENGQIACFTTKTDMEHYAIEQNMNIVDENTNISIIPQRELLVLREENIEKFCETFLTLWNLASDIKNSFTNERSLLDGHKELYDKIFYGCNFSSITPSEYKYVPNLTSLEKRQIKAITNEIYKWFDTKLEIPLKGL